MTAMGRSHRTWVRRLACLVVGWLVAAVPSMPAQAGNTRPSFDCSARTVLGPVEKVICADQVLARLDVRLAGLYDRLLHDVSPADRKILVDAQKTWLDERGSRCKPAGDPTPAAVQAVCGESLRSAYVDRIKALRADTIRRGMPDPLAELRPGQHVGLGHGPDMACGRDAVTLDFGGHDDPDVPSGLTGWPAETYDLMDALDSIGTRGVLDAASADCRLGDGSRVRMKVGASNQQQAYGMCGGTAPERLSVWIDERKVLSSVAYQPCMGQGMESLHVERDRATYCLQKNERSLADGSKMPDGTDLDLKPTRGLCGDLAYARAPGPDLQEFPRNGHPAVPGSLTLAANGPMHAVCERLLPQYPLPDPGSDAYDEAAPEPTIPVDIAQPQWEEVDGRPSQPDLEHLGYNATTLSYQGDLQRARFDLANTGTEATVYRTDDDTHWFDGSALAVDRKDILVTPFDAHDWDASLAKGIYAFVYEHARVFFHGGQTYLLLVPTNLTIDPRVVRIKGKTVETVCAFHRAQERF